MYLFYFIHQNELISRHVNILFAIENERGNRMSFLDVELIHVSGKITTSLYNKQTISGILIHFNSFFMIHLRNWYDSRITI